VDCPACLADRQEDCEYLAGIARAEREREAEWQLEFELIEDRLDRMGARMMRLYEHWNEDEQLMEYMERERD
jgi:hypothetical protein